jgi:hypothetical protein
VRVGDLVEHHQQAMGGIGDGGQRLRRRGGGLQREALVHRALGQARRDLGGQLDLRGVLMGGVQLGGGVARHMQSQRFRRGLASAASTAWRPQIQPSWGLSRRTAFRAARGFFSVLRR